MRCGIKKTKYKLYKKIWMRSIFTKQERTKEEV